jgi:hypothetical protein
MREDWKKVVETCKHIAKQTGVDLPVEFKKQPVDGQPVGRMQADPLFYNQVMVRNLAGFLDEVDKVLTKGASETQKVMKRKANG